MIQPAILLLFASLAGPASGEIVCENRRIPVEVAHNVFVIENETRCFHPPQDRLARLKLACDVLVTAYGETEGRARCRDLISHSGIPALER
ncbi:MAG: hypothetical protein V3V67_10495 [Myxococcota bacterium]